MSGSSVARLDVTKTYKLFINGQFPRSESGRSLAVATADGRALTHVSHASRKDLRDAVEAARAAQVPSRDRCPTQLHGERAGGMMLAQSPSQRLNVHTGDSLDKTGVGP